jgi:hypothetical protein
MYMIEIDNILFGILVAFAMAGFLFCWVSCLNWFFKLGRQRAEKKEEQKIQQRTLIKILEKLQEK